MVKALEAREKLFEEGSKKSWLKKVMGKRTQVMRIQHCWVEGEDGLKRLCHRGQEIKASVDKYFKNWTTKTKTRDDKELVREELQKVYREKKSESLWQIPTEEFPEGDKEFMSREPSWEEFENALKCMGKGKATGPTGYSVELVQQAPREVQELIWDILKMFWREGKVPNGSKAGKIFTLPKTEEDLTTLQNIRPITLLEHVKLKLFTRMIIMRVDKVMEVNKQYILEREQFAGMKGGSTSDPLFIRRSVVEHCKERGEELHIFDSDISKAFDSVHFWSLEQALDRLGMPRHTINLMLSIQGGRSQVIVNGELTKGYEVEKGVRQGEVLSPFLWVAFTDALLAAQKMVGKGVEVGGKEGEEVSVIGSCFMDDAVWYSHDRAEMVQRVEVQAEFCKYHGIKLNMDKSTYTVVKAKEEASPTEVEGKV